jgi:hypothetical protein
MGDDTIWNTHTLLLSHGDSTDVLALGVGVDRVLLGLGVEATQSDRLLYCIPRIE